MTHVSDSTHRVYPPPTSPYAMAQTWRNLLFAHWPVAPEALQPLIPAGLPLDTYEGQAWVGVVPFLMRNIHWHGIPPVPGTGNFLELNVRTYVVRDGRPGVYFLCLDASNRLAVEVARTVFGLPYFDATMQADVAGDDVRYTSTRKDRRGKPAAFAATYAPTSDPFLSRPGSLESWLTERYCLYTVRRGRVARGEIHHPQWPLQPAQADIRLNTMAAAHGIILPDSAPVLHYARKLEVVVWFPTRLL